MRLRTSLLLILALAFGFAGRAHAQGDAWKNAQSAFSQGETYYLSGKFDEAADYFKKAYEARPMPQFLYNIAASFHMKGKKVAQPEPYDMSAEYYARYLSESPTAKDKEQVEKTIAILKAEAERLRAAAAATATQPSDPAAPPPPPPATSAEVEQLGDVKYRGLVVIESEPQGANIYIDGKEKGPFAQTPWSGSMDGEFQYLVEKRGYKSKEGRTAADPSKLLVLQIVLSEEDYLGWLEIKSNVPGAAIYLDDRNVGAIGKTPFSGNFKPGKHKVWIEADGYETAEHDIEIIAGEAAEISAQLKGSPVGYLYVRGPGIESSTIYLDGKLLCERGPCRKPVKEGRHRVSVRRGGYKSFSTSIEVQAKTEINVKAELAKKPGRGDAVVAYIFAGLFAGGGVYLGLQAQNLEKELKDAVANGAPPLDQDDPRFDRGKYYSIGANAAYGVAGLLGIAAIYYTFRDKGRPSTGVVDVRALTLVPTVGPNYAGLTMESSW